MGSISSGIGLASGIDSGSIIEQLVQLERRPIRVLEGRIAQTAEVQVAFTALRARLDGLEATGTALRKPSTFQQSLATSADPDALGATAGPATPEGSYAFRVGRLVSSQQVVTGGVGDAGTDALGGGTVTIELGDARLDRDPPLEELRGGRGVRRGVIEFAVDGERARVDLRDATTLNDFADRINAAEDVALTASVEGGRLTVRAVSGGTLDVRDVVGHAAEDLSMTGSHADGDSRSGDLRELSRATPLSLLRDGRGVTGGPGAGLSVSVRGGQSFDVDMSAAKSVGDVIDAFNAAAGNRAIMTLDDGRIVVEDKTNKPFLGGSNAMTITGRDGSAVADELGLGGSSTAGRLASDQLLANPGSVLLSSLIGGRGLAGGVIEITDARGNSAEIDLRGAGDVQSLLGTINDAGLRVRAQLNGAGNGVDLVNTDPDRGTLAVADVNGTLAADLGWTGDGHGRDALRGANLQRQWLHERTALGDLNGGRGVSLGEVEVTDSAGARATIDFTVGVFETVGDVIAEFARRAEAGGPKVTARLNDQGDGLLIEDAAGGAGALAIDDLSGSTAADLRVAGEHEGGLADGSYETTIEVGEFDTLETIRGLVNGAEPGVRAEVLDTGGAGENRFRLSVGGREGGRAGGFVFDARLGEHGGALLGERIAAARDAAVFLDGDAGAVPLLITSGSNQIDDVVPGLDLDLKRITGRAVTVTVERDLGAATEAVGAMVESFNALRQFVDENSTYNEETDVRGPLLGEPAVQRVERQVYALLDSVRDTGNPRYRILADVGVRIGEGATLEFDADRFRAAWADDPRAVQAMFSEKDAGIGYRLQEVLAAATDPAGGPISNVVDTLGERTADFERQIARIEAGVEVKRERLTKQYVDMELALSKLQFQQQQLSSLPSFDFSGKGAGQK